MANIINKTIISRHQPKQPNVTWTDVSGENSIEKYFINGQWVAVGSGSGGGGGGGGTSDYTDLENKPSINDVTLEGNKTSEQLGIVVPKRIKDDPNGLGVIEGNLQKNKASGLYSHAEGSGTNASGDRSHAEGDGTTAIGVRSHAEGKSTNAIGASSHAEGYGTTASGNNSHAESYGTTASGEASHSEGYDTTASGDRSHAEGDGTNAIGVSSHAEGSGTNASGVRSHAEGKSTTASGNNSHAEGSVTNAIGVSSHAEGSGTEASGVSSHAEGYGTNANRAYQHVFGKYNIVEQGDSRSVGNYVEIVGNGTADNQRRNARTLSWAGKEWLADTLEVSREPESANEVATKGYVDGRPMKRVVVDEEKLIGEWVEDGVTYDMYEKTINFGALTNATQKTVEHGLTNIVRVVGMEGIAVSSSNILPLPTVTIDPNKGIYLACGASNVTITPGSDSSAFNAWVTLRFIRTKQ